jgi:hypothetical protein
MTNMLSVIHVHLMLDLICRGYTDNNFQLNGFSVLVWCDLPFITLLEHFGLPTKMFTVLGNSSVSCSNKCSARHICREC